MASASCITIRGIDEVDGETNDSLRASLKSLFKEKLEIQELLPIAKTYRVREAKQRHATRSSESTKQPCKVFVEFTDHNIVTQLLLSAKKLAEYQPPVYIDRQYPPAVHKRRRVLYPVMKIARNLKMRAHLNDDRLFIDGKEYTVDTVNTVPFKIYDLHMKENANTVVFHGRFAPFSNFYQADFSINGQMYCHVEQHLQHEKAVLAGDNKTAI